VVQVDQPVRVGERGPEPVKFDRGGMMTVGKGGPENAVFLDPVRVYSREQARPGGNVMNVSLDGMVKASITLGGGSPREMARQVMRELDLEAAVLDSLESLIAQYEGAA